MATPLKATLWQSLYNLSESETDLIKKFEKECSGPVVIGVAEILRKRGFVDESLVILEEGVKAFPSFSAVRVALAREYYFKGFFGECLEQLNVALAKSSENLLAQRLKLKISVLLGDRQSIQTSLEILKQLSTDDDSTKIIRQLVGWGDFNHAKKHLAAELQKIGVNIDEEESNNSVKLIQQNSNQVRSSLGSFLSAPKELAEEWKIPSHEIDVDSYSLSGKTSSFEENDSDKETKQNLLVKDNFDLDNPSLPRAFSPGDSLGSIRGGAKRYQLLNDFRMLNTTSDRAEKALIQDNHLDATTLADLHLRNNDFKKAKDTLNKHINLGPSADSGRFLKKIEEIEELERVFLKEKLKMAVDASLEVSSNKIAANTATSNAILSRLELGVLDPQHENLEQPTLPRQVDNFGLSSAFLEASGSGLNVVASKLEIQRKQKSIRALKKLLGNLEIRQQLLDSDIGKNLV